jgi:hypothetical protein
MKYAASQVGSTNVPISQAGSMPWVNINQTTAIANSHNVAGCDGCHLITEAEYLTIVQNVLSVASNWSSGIVGTGYIYSGHNDNSPNHALASDNGYYNTGNFAGDTSVNFGMIGNSQRRTLTLTNGEVIWDLAGNVWEWTSSTIGANQQPGFVSDVAYAWKQWDNIWLLMNGLPSLSQPSSTGLTGISWDSSAGVGQLFSNLGESGTTAFIRGGNWDAASGSGVLALDLSNTSSSPDAAIGFRVSK